MTSPACPSFCYNFLISPNSFLALPSSPGSQQGHRGLPAYGAGPEQLSEPELFHPLGASCVLRFEVPCPPLTGVPTASVPCVGPVGTPWLSPQCTCFQSLGTGPARGDAASAGGDQAKSWEWRVGGATCLCCWDSVTRRGREMLLP